MSETTGDVATQDALTMLGAEDRFESRHLGPRGQQVEQMLSALSYDSVEALMGDVVPESIRLGRALDLPGAATEREALAQLRALADENEVFRSLLGMGYHDCATPAVILRNVIENPGWYTQYTPYQAEIAQGRLEALLNYQTMVADLTGLPVANASLLDEATAAAEAMAMCHGIKRRKGGGTFFVSMHCHPQTCAVVQTRAEPMGIKVVVGDVAELDFESGEVFGVLLQYPTTTGLVCDLEPLTERAHAAGAMVVVAADILALTLLRPPGEFGADIAVGSTQRFGVPLGYGGPHAAYFATLETHRRRIPGRIVGLTRDVEGHPALRLALQTREQHIRRERATSNICTSQVLLAIVASMYAVYHGPEGLRTIARRVMALTAVLREGLHRAGLSTHEGPCFDTLCVEVGEEGRGHHCARQGCAHQLASRGRLPARCQSR